MFHDMPGDINMQHGIPVLRRLVNFSHDLQSPGPGLKNSFSGCVCQVNRKIYHGQWLKKKIKSGCKKKCILRADLPKLCASWALLDGYDKSGQADEEGKPN